MMCIDRVTDLRLQREKLDTNLRVEAPEFVPGFKGGGLWSSDRLLEVWFQHVLFFFKVIRED